MGTLRSDLDLSGVTVAGVLLAPGAIDEDTGQFVWDHPDLPEGSIEPDPWAEF